MRPVILAAIAVILFSVPAEAGWRWLWVPVRAVLVDMALQGALTGHVRSDQSLRVGTMFLASALVSLPDVEVPGIRKLPLWARHATLLGMEFAYSQHLNVRTRSIGGKYGRLFSDWKMHAPDQGENKPLGMSGYMDYNHVAGGFISGALSRAFFPEHREEVMVVAHQFLLFEGIVEAEHFGDGEWLPIPWEYGDLISDLYGCQLWKEAYRKRKGGKR